jgi:hypothetical protein
MKSDMSVRQLLEALEKLRPFCNKCIALPKDLQNKHLIINYNIKDLDCSRCIWHNIVLASHYRRDLRVQRR